MRTPKFLHKRALNIPESLSVAAELDRVAIAWGWTVHRGDWWGPARLAFDSQVTALQTRTEYLAAVARGSS